MHAVGTCGQVSVPPPALPRYPVSFIITSTKSGAQWHMNEAMRLGVVGDRRMPPIVEMSTELGAFKKPWSTIVSSVSLASRCCPAMTGYTCTNRCRVQNRAPTVEAEMSSLCAGFFQS